MEGIIDEDEESNNEVWRRWDDYDYTTHKHEIYGYKNTDEEEYELFKDTTHERPVYKIRRFEMIKYSFGQDEEYVAIKECEYDDLTKTNEDVCWEYQEIFCSMDEGWVSGIGFEGLGGFDSNEEEVVPKVDDVPLVDGVFDGAFGGDGEEDFVMGEGVVVSLDMFTKSCLGGMIVSLIFLEGLKEEAWVESIEVKEK
ncbi:hypothetical protein Tco_1548768 [Tanacetum coccineum]